MPGLGFRFGGARRLGQFHVPGQEQQVPRRFASRNDKAIAALISTVLRKDALNHAEKARLPL